ncbi:MAG: bifunctional N(6)-L-threonylcarbamoyladenine synthase/serine/threonine protein kinase [Methanobacteriaceae archaeon]|nr:bifunctional N(6)-L-threonylcarbamoyladenine synthase/serine/threonine protein kinase [Methanobacteriaceae archaeon]
MICLGIEGTAEKCGIGIVNSNGDILATCGSQLYPEVGGIHPREAAVFHAEHIVPLINDALDEASLSLNDLDLISFSKGPGLGPCLRTVATAGRTLSQRLNIPLIGVNHCIGHIEIGKLTTNAIDPLTVYASGGNTQIISFESGRYRILGETLDIAVGNCLDQFSRSVGLGHPGGPVVEKLASKTNEVIDLPYVVKGMDFSFSGILTSAIKLYKKGVDINIICNSFQETCFSMLCEVTERALSHSNKDEVLLCGGVAANSRLREMLKIMCEEHFSTFYMPEMKYCGDNGSMIAWLGLLSYNYNGNKGINIEDSVIDQRFRTNQVDAGWNLNNNKGIKLPNNLYDKGAEADVFKCIWDKDEAICKIRPCKSYRSNNIDKSLRLYRLREEVRLLNDCKNFGVSTPSIFNIDINNMSIVMEYVKGVLLNDIIIDILNNKLNEDVLFDYCNIIGSNVSLMHDNGIIHGDLTSKNIFINDNKAIFIDFGLGKYSDVIEDKGTDVLVFKKSLESIIPKFSEDCFNSFINGYKSVKDFDLIYNKIDEIISRGRYL